jgi:hypothetical protein
MLLPLLLTLLSGPSDSLWTVAERAWGRGDYVVALEALDRLLAAPDAAAYRQRIALLTGELHQVRELTPDGARPQFAPDGAHLSYETGTGIARRTRIVRTADGRVVTELVGGSAAIAPNGGLVAWILPTETSRVPLGVHDFASGRELPIEGLAGWLPSGVTFGLDAATLYVTAMRADAPDRNAILRVTREGNRFVVRGTIGEDAGFKHAPRALPGGRYLLHTVPAGNPVRLPTGAAGYRMAQAFAIVDLAANTTRRIAGLAPAVSANGRQLAWLVRDGATTRVMTMAVGDSTPREVLATTERVDAPALSPDGSRIAYQRMPFFDWEIFVVGIDGTNDRRLTREIQHDLFPEWLDDRTLIAVMGEARHRRVHHYDVATGARTKLFHNNTVRTIAPEYEWVPSADGTRLLVVAERDGDTVSPERGVYLLDLTREVSPETLVARVRTSLAAERDLRARGTASFAPIAAAVRARTSEVDVGRVHDYAQALFGFDSKHISQLGNARAIAWLDSTYRSFGLEVRRQYFRPRGALGDSTANVLAILRGTTNPELVYIVSSHFDSRAEGPGADDNSSGTSALLEAARVLATHPQPATIIFASFTGEESGLLGSREWVRQAVADSVRLLGALNNDMVGWANDHRLDNTIRYSNPGIRDLQHAAAMQFSELITYDALYYKNTDAHAYYEAWGDIVGGIGSYPVLGNPHYHQPHDVLETINHRLVAEVGRVTVATLMRLASSPARLGGLRATATGDGVEVTWQPAPERGVTGYVVEWAGGRREVPTTSVRLPALPRGSEVLVKALHANGLDGWDWARVAVAATP